MMNYTLQDMIVAYRKAKADAWQRHDLDELAYARYEDDILQNLQHLLDLIQGDDYSSLLTIEILGGWKLMAKKIAVYNNDGDDLIIESGQIMNADMKHVREVSYRVYAKPSVEFQVLSSLWIQKVGWKFDKRLGKNIYGNRLRPFKDGKPNDKTSGSFRRYVPMFSRWKHDGIAALEKALDKTKAVVITADAKNFFHSLRPDFLLSREFLKNNHITLTADERSLTKCLIDAINLWSSSTPLRNGLPVGLAASGVIANAALLDFDRAMNSVEGLIFYGRYVDDILIVFSNKNGIATRTKAWNHIIASNYKCLTAYTNESKIEDNKNSCEGIYFSPSYKESLTSSSVLFTGEKCKAFFLDKETGRSFVETLQQQIVEVTSEFRYLPETVVDSKAVETRIQKLLTANGELADNFRKIDAFVLKRNDLRSVLREFRFLMRTLPSACWQKQRKALYKIVARFMYRPQFFFEYAHSEMVQVFSLATACGDFEDLQKLLSKAWHVADKISKFKTAKISGCLEFASKSSVGDKWRDELFRFYERSMTSAIVPRSGNDYLAAYKKFHNAYKNIVVDSKLPATMAAFRLAEIFALHDVASNSFLSYCYGIDMRPFGSTFDGVEESTRAEMSCDEQSSLILGASYCQACNELWNYIKAERRSQNAIPLAILFPTRPISVREIALLGARCYVKSLDSVFEELRGYNPELAEMTKCTLDKGEIDLVTVCNSRCDNPTVALLNLSTEREHCSEALAPIDDEQRMKRFKLLVEMINQILSQPQYVDYIVFHELSIPLRWFVAFSDRCKESGVSLIAGTTYRVLDAKKKACRNELWMSLGKTNKTGSFREAFLRSEAKSVLAYQEALNLEAAGWTHDSGESDTKHAIIQHGNFAFSSLICAELTEISARARLVGAIDALFVLAWNRDVTSFSALIESAAIDLHAYIIQSNNNLFGDSRIRAPAINSWERDVVRLRGGSGAYCVIGTLDVNSLREFQSKWDPKEYFADAKDENDKDNHKANHSFKPLPLGFGKLPSYRLYKEKD